jgi:hypothetical protein
MEISSMLDRLSRDGFPEMLKGKLQGFNVSTFQRFEGLKVLLVKP